MKEQQISVSQRNPLNQRFYFLFRTEWTTEKDELSATLEGIKQGFPAPEFSISVHTRETKQSFEVVN